MNPIHRDSEEPDQVIDLDASKLSPNAALWWKMCIFVEAHFRRAKLQKDDEN